MSGSAVPAIIAIKMRRYKAAFRAAGATTPDTAMRPAEAGLRQSLIFQKLVRQRILMPVGDGRYYLDETRDEAVMRTKRRILAVLVVVLLVLFIIGALAAWTK